MHMARHELSLIGASIQGDSERFHGLLCCCRLRTLFFKPLRPERRAGFICSWRSFYNLGMFSSEVCKVRATLPQI